MENHITSKWGNSPEAICVNASGLFYFESIVVNDREGFKVTGHEIELR